MIKPSYDELILENRRLKAQLEQYRPNGMESDTSSTLETLLKGIVAPIPIGVAFLSGGILRWVNDYLCRMVGYSVSELTGKYMGLLFRDPDEKDHIEKIQSEVQSDGKWVDVETVFRSKDGRFINVLVMLTPQDPRDRSKGLLFIARDISQRKAFERELKTSEEKYRTVVENSKDAIFIFQETLIKFFNEKALEVLGYSREELYRLPPFSILHPEDREIAAERHVKRMKGETLPTHYPIRIFRKDGQMRWFDLKGVFIHWEGKPATISFLSDITEQKKLAEQLQQAQKMEALGTLAGGIAHDFNNLLMGIQGRSSVMLMETDRHHPHHHLLKGIEACVRSATDLTKQILGYARGGKYEVKATDIALLIQKSSQLFARTRKEIAVHINCPDNVWPVLVDAAQIEQVLLNFYVNAWHAMPGGGTLLLGTENVIVDEIHQQFYDLKTGRYVKVSVTDSGVGMDENTQKRIFEPFFTTKAMGRGSGLGLASAYGIIRNHHGRISVYSEKGAGTTFHVYLPASPVEAQPLQLPTEEVVKGNETILLVDDEAMILTVGRLMLEKLGYTVITAKNGNEAVMTLENQAAKIDMVILDMVMPGMSGATVFDRLRTIDPGLKILLASGYSINGEAQWILDRGCNGFIQKPFSLFALSHAIEQVLSRNRPTE